MAEGAGGVRYVDVEAGYFEKRGLKRYAGVWSLWALGVGAVISGHYSGWNIGLAQGGWGGMLVATALITAMYLGLTYSIAEMSPALPHTGGAYSFARTAMGPWGGFVTGLAENVEYVLTPAVIVFFIGSYMTGVFETPAALQPVWWVAFYAVFLWLNIAGVELSFRVTLAVTLAALAVLVVFWVSALPNIDFDRWALNIGPTARSCPRATAPGCRWGSPAPWSACRSRSGCSSPSSSSRWRPRRATTPKRDMPTGIIAGMFT
jgi:ethanolamine permease